MAASWDLFQSAQVIKINTLPIPDQGKAMSHLPVQQKTRWGKGLSSWEGWEACAQGTELGGIFFLMATPHSIWTCDRGNSWGCISDRRYFLHILLCCLNFPQWTCFYFLIESIYIFSKNRKRIIAKHRKEIGLGEYIKVGKWRKFIE